MKPRRVYLFASKLAVITALVALTALSATAEDRDHDKDHPRECSVKTLHGNFGWFGQGTVLAVPNVHPALPLVVSGVFTYDGEGNFSGTYNQNVAGTFATGLKAEGIYQVNADCTYSSELTLLVDNSQVHRTGVITGEGINREVHILYSDSSPVAFGTLKKTPDICSLETLKGDYALYGNGLIFVSPTTSIPRATAGLLTFDGKGNFAGAATGNTNGGVAHGSFTGRYTLTPDCEVTAEIEVTDGPNQGVVITEVGSVTGEGESKEIHDIFTAVVCSANSTCTPATPPGQTQHWVFTDTLKSSRQVCFQAA